jgi:hypothetical protein
MKCGPEQALHARIARAVVVLMLACLLVPAAARAQGPDDDWTVVGHENAQSPSGVENVSPARSSSHADVSNAAIVACGERARPAKPPYTDIMANLNSIWGSNAKIYESIRLSGPHARRGGCIFYNRRFLRFLTRKWMGIENPAEVKPMLYAIFAHELGHVEHGDLTPSRANVPLEQRELEADRFAGYTLFELNIRFSAEDLATYYRLIGDDFFGVRNSHGSSNQRANAFEHGYDLARMGLPESNGQPPAGLSSNP